MIVSYYIISTDQFDRSSIKQLYVKLTIFPLLPVSALNTILHNQVVPKKVVEKFNFSELKIKKVKFFTQSPTKKFYISIFNVGGCLASCLTFRPFSTLDLQQLDCLSKSPCVINTSYRHSERSPNRINSTCYVRFIQGENIELIRFLPLSIIISYHALFASQRINNRN